MAASVFLDEFLRPSDDRDDAARQQGRVDNNLRFLADVLVDYGRGSPLVRANAYQLAVDMKRRGYGDEMWTRVQGLYGWERGTELRASGSSMVFCPAVVPPLAGTADGGLGLEAQELFGGEGWVAPSVMQAGDPNGLFLMLEEGRFLV